ncbi:MAG: 6-carboxytetrahydropterin synthase [Parashewanella sp.]
MLLFVKDLTVIDFSYLCATRGMVGESWIVDVVLEGGLDSQSMVLDFGKVKKVIKRTIDDIIDHRLVVPVKSNKAKKWIDGERVLVDFDSEKGSIHLACPEQAFTFIESDDISFESVIEFIKAELAKVLPNNVDNIELTLRTEQLDRPYYHYSHGLKKHDGNCQRIAHGHRSPISIFENGKESLEWNLFWAQRWQDIYLVSAEDVVSCADLSLSQSAQLNDDSHLCSKYQAPQGEFQLAMPRAHCEIIPHDTTVELLADYIVETLSNMRQENDFKVVAFEGVGKGAIASRKKLVG